ncbi:MAG: hypothetical protein OXH07_06545 [Chloroflexi bacterium]|nr:hypothetical protein [Chloroflexota bacterium]
MKSAAVPIDTLALEAVVDAVRQTLRGPLTPGSLEDFLASVDWSNQERASQAIREMLGALEQCATEFAEADLGEVDYRERLLSLLPAGDRLQPIPGD